MALSNIPPDVVYPVFKLPAKYVKAYRGPQGFLYAETLSGIPKVVDTVYDSTTTLGERRLQVEPKELAKLSLMLSEPKDIILSANRVGRIALYLDSRGKVFGYQKSDWGKVRSFLIEKITSAPSYKFPNVLKLRGVHCPIPSKHLPEDYEMYASLLCYSNGYLFLGYGTEPHEQYRLKV